MFADVRVLDLADASGALAGKLRGDLGAGATLGAELGQATRGRDALALGLPRALREVDPA